MTKITSNPCLFGKKIQLKYIILIAHSSTCWYNFFFCV